MTIKKKKVTPMRRRVTSVKKKATTVEKKVITMKISEIIVEDRKRQAKDIDNLAKSIEELGLLNPITVNMAGRLIAGLNRLEACKKLGWNEIPVTAMDIDGLKAELAEIDENLVRQELTTLENSEQVKRRQKIYEELYPESIPKEQRKKGLNFSGEIISSLEDTPTFTEDTAQKTGKSQRSIQQDIQIADNIPEEVKEEIRGTRIEDSKTELLEIARIEPEKQKEVVKKVKSGQVKSVKEAVKGKPQPKDKATITPEKYEKLQETCTKLEQENRRLNSKVRELELDRKLNIKGTLQQGADEVLGKIVIDPNRHVVAIEYSLPPGLEIKDQDPECLLQMAKGNERNKKNTNIESQEVENKNK